MSVPGRATDEQYMRLALRLARRGYGATSPNPMVGAVLVKAGRILGQGWHRRAGEPHAEIEAIRQARERGFEARGATLYVTLEPCSTSGRTPPCTGTILESRIKRVVAGDTDPNPKHAGRGFKILERAGIAVSRGVLADECARLNDSFNHWIVHRTPLVTVKAAMSLDGKIATAAGFSKWITGERARAYAMRLRQGADALLVGVNTILADNPSLTFRGKKRRVRTGVERSPENRLRRIILDSRARTPLDAKVISDAHAHLTTVVVTDKAPQSRITELGKRVRVLVAPATAKSQPKQQGLRRAQSGPRINLGRLLRILGAEDVTSLLVEGGGEVNASFLLEGLAQRIAFFYAPKVLGGRDAVPAVGGIGISTLEQAVRLTNIEWHRLGPDLLLTARVL